jgi:heme/copper-type cytochrome/quinol oxidase subunit 2
MAHLKKLLASAVVASTISALLALQNDWLVVMAAGALGAIAVSVIFLLVLIAVKLTRYEDSTSYEQPNADEKLHRLTGFDAEGNLMIHSWLRHGGK